MREISFVKRLKFRFNGSVAKNALVIGDADNDQHSELVCANLQGDLAIFKGKSPDSYAYSSNLGMVTACIIGDVINSGKNYVAAINTEGWLFIFDVNNQSSRNLKYNHSTTTLDDSNVNLSNSQANEAFFSRDNNLKKESTASSTNGIKLTPLYDQRMPSNCKELLLADLDGDGQNEVIVGLTDRVLRTYKWVKIGPDIGKFVGLYKWEFADQIGAISLNPSRHENCQDIIVAQPGGTYAKLECFDKKPTILSNSTSNSSNEQKQSSTNEEIPQSLNDNLNNGDNVRTEYISKLTPEYHQLAITQMRNNHISTEIIGGIRDAKDSNSYSLIVIATLDGTLMLVNRDEILWSLQVDHQLFALAILESLSASNRSSIEEDFSQHPMLSQSKSTCTIVPYSENESKSEQFTEEIVDEKSDSSCKKSQYFVVCAWNGKTYIIDEERNYLRFKFDEAVSAFTAGNYYFDSKDYASLVYATFNNQIVLYYDVILDQIRPMYLLDEVMNAPDELEFLEKVKECATMTGYLPCDQKTTDSCTESCDIGCQQHKTDGTNEEIIKKGLHNFLNDLLYNLTDDELANNK